MDQIVHIYGFCVQRMAQAAGKVMALIRAGIESTLLLCNRHLLELRTSAGSGEDIDWRCFALDPHHEFETIGEQFADHLLLSASDLAVLKIERTGMGGRFG